MNPLDGLSDKIEMTEKEVSDLEYRAIEIIQHLKCICKYIFYWKKSYDQPRQHIKKQRHYFANKVPSSQGYVLRL